MSSKKNIFAFILILLAMTLSLYELIDRDNWATKVWPLIFFVFSLFVLVVITKDVFKKSK